MDEVDRIIPNSDKNHSIVVITNNDTKRVELPTPGDEDGEEFDFSDKDFDDSQSEKSNHDEVVVIGQEIDDTSIKNSSEIVSDNNCSDKERLGVIDFNSITHISDHNQPLKIIEQGDVDDEKIDEASSERDLCETVNSTLLLRNNNNKNSIDERFHSTTASEIIDHDNEDFNNDRDHDRYSADHSKDGDHDDDDDEDDVFYSDDHGEDELIVNFLDTANHIAEARLAARRQARAEAREIRMRELERQQKEQEQNADRAFDMQTAAGIDPLSRSRITMAATAVRGNSMSSRRSSEDSLEEEGRSLRDIRHELKDVEERFRKAMIANAQLDNERASQSYQIQLLKDKLEEMEESYSQLQREYKEKCRDHNALKRNFDKLEEELKLVRGQLDERDTLITEQGLVIVLVENEDGSDARRALVSMENAQLLGSVQGSLDVRLKKFAEEKQLLQKEVQALQQQLSDIKTQGRRGGSMNGPLSEEDDYDAQREANKVIADYKYKLQKAEQEIASLQASLARSETQVIRYKSTAEAAEKAEGELKIERRKLQRENREATERLEELETANNHLLKRLDKLKNAKSALLKDL